MYFKFIYLCLKFCFHLFWNCKDFKMVSREVLCFQAKIKQKSYLPFVCENFSISQDTQYTLIWQDPSELFCIYSRIYSQVKVHQHTFFFNNQKFWQLCSFFTWLWCTFSVCPSNSSYIHRLMINLSWGFCRKDLGF